MEVVILVPGGFCSGGRPFPLFQFLCGWAGLGLHGRLGDVGLGVVPGLLVGSVLRRCRLVVLVEVAVVVPELGNPVPQLPCVFFGDLEAVSELLALHCHISS